MSRKLSKNERRLGALALFCLFWGAFLVVLGGSLALASAAVVIVVGAAAVALEGRRARTLVRSGVRAVLCNARALGTSGGTRALHAGRAACARFGRVDWESRRESFHRRAQVAARALRAGARSARDAARRAAAQTAEKAQTAQTAQSRSAVDRRREALRLNEQATALRQAGRIEEALVLGERALQVFRGLGDARSEALTLNGIGLTLARGGDADGAAERYRTALSLLGALADPHAEGRILANLGALHRGRGREEEARAVWQDALERLEPGSPEHDRTARQLRLAS